MRARNREINIFNMSLLDILTGMLGAFLFLMLGLLPYYAKVSRNKDINPEEVKQLREENKNLRDQTERQQQQIADLQKQLDELQKLVKAAAGGPMTAEQIQQLMDQMNQMRQQLDQLRAQLQQAQNQAQQLQAQNGQLQSQLQQAQQQAQQDLQQMKQQLDDVTKDRDYWRNQQGTLSIASQWNSSATDIDVMVMAPDGTIYSPKVDDRALGRKCVYDGDDSHYGGHAYNNEGLIVFLDKPGDYLVFYRVPKGADPATYAALRGNMLFSNVMGKDKGVKIREDSLGDSRAQMARPGGLYAWAIINYDADQPMVVVKPPTGKLPPGIEIPSGIPDATATPPAFPFQFPPRPHASGNPAAPMASASPSPH